MRRIGILGGTFDPIHVGHLRIAMDAIECLGLDEVRLIPNHIPPHRPLPQASSLDRWKMLNLATQKHSTLVPDDIEINNPKMSWSLATLNTLKERDAHVQWMWLMGWDVFASLNTWENPDAFISGCHLVVFPRSTPLQTQAPLAPMLQELMDLKPPNPSRNAKMENGQMTLLSTEPIGVSASNIRFRMAQGMSIDYLTPQTVKDYIERHHLYQAEKVSPYPTKKHHST